MLKGELVFKVAPAVAVGLLKENRLLVDDLSGLAFVLPKPLNRLLVPVLVEEVSEEPPKRELPPEVPPPNKEEPPDVGVVAVFPNRELPVEGDWVTEEPNSPVDGVVEDEVPPNNEEPVDAVFPNNEVPPVVVAGLAVLPKRLVPVVEVDEGVPNKLVPVEVEEGVPNKLLPDVAEAAGAEKRLVPEAEGEVREFPNKLVPVEVDD